MIVPFCSTGLNPAASHCFRCEAAFCLCTPQNRSNMCCNRTGRRLQVLRTVFIPKRKKILFLKKQVLYRIFFYVLALLILALGLTLNTKAGLGVSPIISVSYSVSQIFTLNFGNTTMFLYCVFVLVQHLAGRKIAHLSGMAA